MSFENLRVLQLDSKPKVGDIIDCLSDLAKTHGRNARLEIDGFGCDSDIEEMRVVLRGGEVVFYLVARRRPERYILDPRSGKEE